MIFINFEINDIDLETLFFIIFKIPAVKISISGKNVFCFENFTSGQHSFYRDHSF